MNRIIKVGSRDSALAVIQAQIVIDAVKKINPDIDFEMVKIKTTGDKLLDKSLDTVGGKGLFIKELENALADRVIDIAVHSLKDMPCQETEGLPVVALSERESPFDALVLPQGVGAPDRSKPVGCSSRRRAIQFAKLYEGYAIRPVRGNVPTRLAKLDNGEYSALILAQAGLNRLSLGRRSFRVFALDEMIPAASQGILAVQGRAGEEHGYLEGFCSEESGIVSRAERQFLKTLDGGCSSPVAAYARLHNSELLLTGMYVGEGGNAVTGEKRGNIDNPESLGEELALFLKERAG